MIKQLISYETAKLAKEKEFPQNFWMEMYNLTQSLGIGTGVAIEDSRFISAPTQSLLQKWLRDVHKLHIVMIPTPIGNWTYKVIDVQIDPSNVIVRPPYSGVCGDDFSSYEDALEAGLVALLNLTV